MIVVQRTGDQIRLIGVDGPPGNVVPTDSPPNRKDAWASAACTIRLPYQLASLGQIDSVVSDLERTRYPGWQQSPWLAGELGLELDNELTAIVSGRLQRYDNNLGLLVSQPNQTGDS